MDTTLLHTQRLLAQNIRRLRMEQGITQERLAEAAEIDVRHIQRIEAGEGNPRLSTLCMLATALDTSPGELIAGDIDGRQHPASPYIKTR